MKYEETFEELSRKGMKNNWMIVINSGATNIELELSCLSTLDSIFVLLIGRK